MLRTKNIDLPKWRKDGRGSFRMASGKIIKPGQIFSAKESDIPSAFRNLVVQINAEDEKEAIIIPISKSPAFEVQPITPAVQKILDDFNANPVCEEIAPVEVESDDIKVEIAGQGWYNVVNSTTGKILNEKKLRLQDAEAMRFSLI